MRKLIFLISALLCSAAALAQTPEEILSRMETAMAAHEKDGIVMTVDVKIPIHEVIIEKENPDRPTSSEGDTEMFNGIAEGYDVTLSKETDKAWYFNCKKSKDNKEKDVPKTIDIVVAKGTYYPVSLSAQMKGITVTMRGISFGVTEKQVSFDAKDYPNVKITDKR